jgi:hypothetical protein
MRCRVLQQQHLTGRLQRGLSLGLVGEPIVFYLLDSDYPSDHDKAILESAQIIEKGPPLRSMALLPAG